MTRKINTEIALGGVTFREGDEAALLEVAELLEVDLTTLAEGTVEGDWTSTKKAAGERVKREQVEVQRQERLKTMRENGLRNPGKSPR